MKILVTGGSGFIGTNLVSKLLSIGHDVLNIDLSEPKDKGAMDLWRRADIRDLDSLLPIWKDFDPAFVFHLAARTDLDGKSVEDYSANTLGVGNVVECVKNSSRLEGVVFASSRLVCDIGYLPMSDTDFSASTAYGQSKIEGELLVREKTKDVDVPWCIVRPTSIWGPWFDVPYKTFFSSILNGTYVNPTRSPIKKSFGYVGNSVLQLTAMLGGGIGQVRRRSIYLADDPPIIVQDLASMIAHEFGVRQPRTLPLALLKGPALAGDFLKVIGIKNPPLTSFRLRNLTANMVYPLDEINSLFVGHKILLEDAVRQTCGWMRGGRDEL